MDLENQRRVKELAERIGRESLVVLLGGAEAESVGLAAETVITGDPTYAGVLAGVPLGLSVFHVLEPEVKLQITPNVFDDQVGMMEMVLEVEKIRAELDRIRNGSE